MRRHGPAALLHCTAGHSLQLLEARRTFSFESQTDCLAFIGDRFRHVS
jgi:hypothetical protein